MQFFLRAISLCGISIQWSGFTIVQTVEFRNRVKWDWRSHLCEQWWRWVLTSLFDVSEILEEQKDQATPAFLRKQLVQCIAALASLCPLLPAQWGDPLLSYLSFILPFFIRCLGPSSKLALRQTRVTELPLWCWSLLLFVLLLCLWVDG